MNGIVTSERALYAPIEAFTTIEGKKLAVTVTHAIYGMGGCHNRVKTADGKEHVVPNGSLEFPSGPVPGRPVPRLPFKPGGSATPLGTVKLSDIKTKAGLPKKVKP
jgi:hypothetical protein